MVDEAERSLHDALSVLSQTVKETRTVLGGGCSKMLMSCAVEKARKIKGKKAIATEAFSRALRQIPAILADNAGYDSSDLVTKLRAAHYEGQADAGLGKSLKCFSFLSGGCDFFSRYGPWVDWVDERVGCDGELQVEAAGAAERLRGCGDDHPVRSLGLDIDILAYLVIQRRRYPSFRSTETGSCMI